MVGPYPSPRKDATLDRKGHRWQGRPTRDGEIGRLWCELCGTVYVHAPNSGMRPLHLGRVFYLEGPESHFWRTSPLCSKVLADHPWAKKPVPLKRNDPA